MKRFVMVVVFVASAGCGPCAPTMARWEGEADYAKAEQNRKIAVLEAEATLQASKLKAQAEVERAKGVAEANRIIGDSLKGNEGYLQYLFIKGITEDADQKPQIIYVPTEGSLPILEAGRIAHGTAPALTPSAAK